MHGPSINMPLKRSSLKLVFSTFFMLIKRIDLNQFFLTNKLIGDIKILPTFTEL